MPNKGLSQFISNSLLQSRSHACSRSRDLDLDQTIDVGAVLGSFPGCKFSRVGRDETYQHGCLKLSACRLRELRPMIAQFTKNERQLALIILLAMSICGLAMAVAGSGDPLGIHGAIVLLAGSSGTVRLISGHFGTEPRQRRPDPYFHDSSPVGIILSVGWGL